MKRRLAASALAVTLLFTGLASAESLFSTDNASAQVTFYNADPADGGQTLATTIVNNSPVAVAIDGIDNATYMTVTYEGESYSFALAESGVNKNEVVLDLTNSGENATPVADKGEVTLTDLMDALAENPELLEQLQSRSI